MSIGYSSLSRPLGIPTRCSVAACTYIMCSHFGADFKMLPCVAGGVALGAALAFGLAHVWSPAVYVDRIRGPNTL